MGGPKINRTGQNRIGRKPRTTKALGMGKRNRKIKHNAKKRRNMNKKMLKYYDDIANPQRAIKAKEEAAEADSLTQQITRKLPGKKLRKIRKIIQRTQRDKSQMEVEVVQASRKEKVSKDAVSKTAVSKTADKLETDETTQHSDNSDWEEMPDEVEMKEDDEA